MESSPTARPQAGAVVPEGGAVSLNFASWNQLDEWLRRVNWLRSAA